VLSDTYFEQLNQYASILKTVNEIPEAAQQKRTPTGSCVIGWTAKLLSITEDSENDSPTLQAFKSAPK